MKLGIIILPLIASILATVPGAKGPKKSIFTMLLATLIGLTSIYEIGIKGSPVTIILGQWLDLYNKNVSWSFTFDSLSISMFIPILIISTLIQIYSFEYKGHDPNRNRFFSLLSLFSYSMLIIVTADNILLILLGWEKVGLSSYLLISFWNTRISANLGALSALFQNKVGDLSFILGLVFTFGMINDLSLQTLFSLSNTLNKDLIFWICFFILIAAMSKSAFYPFNTWLIRAKEGPTSVSSLLHSSTKVTAGIFLIVRFSFLFEKVNEIVLFMLFLGSIGTLYGAAAALLENDIKGIIAYSTSSQLGYKKVGIGLSLYNIAIWHLITHAFFKSLLFKSSGAIIHAFITDNQDIRRKGSLNRFLPLTYIFFLFGSLSLKAAPFLSGMYSKDFLLEILAVPHSFSHTLSYILTLLAASFTSLYSLRVFLKVFFYRPNFSSSLLPFVHDSGAVMTFPLFILSLGAIFFGYLLSDLIIGPGSTYWHNALYISPFNNRFLDSFISSSILPLIPLLFLFLLLILLFPTSSISKSQPLSSTKPLALISRPEDRVNIEAKPSTLPLIFRLFPLQNIPNYWLKECYLRLANNLFLLLDRGFFELLGPLGLFRSFSYLSFLFDLLSTQYILHYLFYIIGYSLSIIFLYLYFLLI